MYQRGYKAAVAVPPLVWVTLLLLVPYLMLFCYSFWTVVDQRIVADWGLQNYRTLLENPMYLSVLWRSIQIALWVTLFSVALGYPLAYTLAFSVSETSRFREALYQLVIIPLWISYLVRGYAWKTILGGEGVLNGLLQFIGLTDAPVESLLYSPFAVVITLTHIYTPFVFLPIYAALEHIPRNLATASLDLGATPFQTFRKVILPLSLPGVITGALFAFVLSLGDFLAPQLVGGPSGIMISNIVVSLFGAAYNWPLGAAISFLLLFFVLILIQGAERLERKWSRAR